MKSKLLSPRTLLGLALIVVAVGLVRQRAIAQSPLPFRLGELTATNLTDANGTLYFAGLLPGPFHIGLEPWRSDGTLAGTALIKDIHDQNDSFGYDSFPETFTPLANGIVLFTALTGDAFSGFPTYGEGEELWRTDGTPDGTWLVKDIWPGPDSGFTTSPDPFTTFNGVAYFRANDGVNGFELWRSDGTTAGTVMVKDIRLGPDDSAVSAFREYNGLLYFSADDGTGAELWSTNGTLAGTRMVVDINPAGASSPGNLTVVGGWLYFAADDGLHGRGLWKTDGTAAGTSLVADLRVGASISPEPTGLTELNGQIAFWASYTFDGRVCGPELFVSDGTANGTVRLEEEPGCTASNPSAIAKAGNVLYYAGSGIVSGTPVIGELWKTDGTPAGTVLVADINPGLLKPSDPSRLTPANGYVYFTADEPSTGRELWRTDGTTAGTELIADLTPGALSTNPQELTVSGAHLFFVYGQNAAAFPVGSLWALPLESGSGPEQPVITPVINGSLGANGWFVSDVSVSWTIDDKGSPITGSSGCDAQILTTDTAGLSLICSATNVGGTTSAGVTIKRDATPPVAVPAASPAPSASGWYNTDVVVSWSGTDETSGIASCTSPRTIADEGSDQSSGPGACVDNAGLVSVPMLLAGINIDKTLPTADVIQPGIFNIIPRHSVLEVQFRCEDALSGVVSCTGTQPAGSLLNTTKRLKKATFSVVIMDRAGNVATIQVPYEISPK